MQRLVFRKECVCDCVGKPSGGGKRETPTVYARVCWPMSRAPCLMGTVAAVSKSEKRKETISGTLKTGENITVMAV